MLTTYQILESSAITPGASTELVASSAAASSDTPVSVQEEPSSVSKEDKSEAEPEQSRSVEVVVERDTESVSSEVSSEVECAIRFRLSTLLSLSLSLSGSVIRLAVGEERRQHELRKILEERMLQRQEMDRTKPMTLKGLITAPFLEYEYDIPFFFISFSSSNCT